MESLVEVSSCSALAQPVLLDDVGRGLVQDAFQAAVEVADAYAHLVGDEFRRYLRVGNVVVDDLQHLVDELLVVLVEHLAVGEFEGADLTICNSP